MVVLCFVLGAIICAGEVGKAVFTRIFDKLLVHSLYMPV